MFQALRQNSPVYILHKTESPYFEIGYVTSVSTPQPKFPSNFSTPPNMVVDISVKIDTNVVNYTGLPAAADIADSFTNNEVLVISDNRDAMNAELSNLKQKSEDIIKSVDTHQSLVVAYNKILEQLNPEYAEKKQQQEEIAGLRKELAAMREMLKQLNEEKK